MRLVIYDIQHPIDPQVNGYGLYRTVVDGSVNLRIARVHIPLYTTYACTAPWEAADCTDEGLILVGASASLWTFNVDGTNTVQGCTSTQIWEIESEQFRNSEDYTYGYRGLNLWEKEFLLARNANHVQTRWTWAYCSTLLDDELGVPVEDDNDVPPLASLVTTYQEHTFLAGDPENPHYLYWSKRFRPESWPQENFLEIGNADDPITQITTVAGVLGVFTRSTKYRLTGNTDSGFVHWEALSHRGTRSPKSVVTTDKGVVFVSPDGVWISNFIEPDRKLSDKIEGLFLGADHDANMEEDPINQDALVEIAATHWKNRYYFSYPSGTSITNDRTAVYDFATEEWTIYDHAMSSMMTEHDTNLLVAGGTNGNLYVLETDTGDGSSLINFEAKTKEYYEGQAIGIKCLFLYFTVDAKVPENASITAQFIVDGEEVGDAVTITGDRTKVLQHLPEGCVGYRWQVHVTGATDHAELEIGGVGAYYLPLGIP